MRSEKDDLKYLALSTLLYMLLLKNFSLDYQRSEISHQRTLFKRKKS